MSEPPREPSGWRRARRIVGRAVLVLLLLVVAYLALTPTGRYVVRAAIAEARILAARRPIAELVRDPRVPEPTRQKLQLVLDARRFAQDSVGLEPRESFTTFTQLASDTLVLVLSAAPRDELKSHTWWFPIVGSVPYKGYFDFGLARREAERMQGDGFDTYLRPASAFSTLGWFNDPLLSTTLRADSIALANTIIHELTHNRFYAPGAAVFNESFANFVGARGAAWFLRTRGSVAAAERSDARWEDDKLMAVFWETLHARIDSAFRAHPDSRDARLAAREAIYGEARRQLRDDLAPRLKTIAPASIERVRLDNAALLARRIYLTELELFDAVWVREGASLPRTIERVIELAKSRPDDPFGAVREWVAGVGVAGR